MNKEKILDQARAFVDEGRYDKAIREYEKILHADPADMRVRLRIAELYVKRKQVSDAIRIYREVATSYTRDGFYLKAVTVYKNILRLNPSLVEINELLANLYEKMGLGNDALREYDIVASSLEHKGEFARVLEIRKKIVDLMPEDGDARVRLAELFQREGRAEEALDQYEDYAHRLEKSGNNEARLVEMYEKILSYRENRPQMLRALVRIYFRGGHIKKALKWLEFAKALTSTDTELLDMQAGIYARLNQLETARAKYLMVADLYKDKGDTHKALEALARIALMIPGEEERVEKRAEEILPGTAVQLKETLRRLRAKEDLEAAVEMDLPQTTPAVAEAPPAPKVEAMPEAAPAAEAPVSVPVSVPARKEPRIEKPPRDLDRTIIMPLPAAKAAVAPKSERPVKKGNAGISPHDLEKLKHARSSWNLAKLYRKIGLDADATSELGKAEDIYRELADVSDEAKKRLEELRDFRSAQGSPHKKT